MAFSRSLVQFYYIFNKWSQHMYINVTSIIRQVNYSVNYSILFIFRKKFQSNFNRGYKNYRRSPLFVNYNILYNNMHSCFNKVINPNYSSMLHYLRCYWRSEGGDHGEGLTYMLLISSLNIVITLVYLNVFQFHGYLNICISQKIIDKSYIEQQSHSNSFM